MSNNVSIYYSKPSIDIDIEGKNLVDNEVARYNERYEISLQLDKFPVREECNCCGIDLSDKIFYHRELLFKECENCGHIQTNNIPPIAYPEYSTTSQSTFSQVYPSLSQKEYISRRDRIYTPKIEWVLNALNKLNFDIRLLCNKKWCEIGSGAGYFLSAAKEQGIEKFVGIERDERLCSESLRHNPNNEVHHCLDSFDSIIKNHSSDVYCSFFVLEHINDLTPVWKEIKNKPVGTIFIFSVPVFGASCLLENIFSSRFARNLDGVIHTQLFTDNSIKYAMNLASCRILAEWIFGQDVSDLIRFLQYNDGKNENVTDIHSKLYKNLNRAHDALQSVLDHYQLSDQRHFIAIRE